MWTNFSIIDNAVQEMIDLVNESVFPTDDMTLRPPIIPPGMIIFGNQDIMKTLGLFGFFTHPEDLQFVQTLQVETYAAFLSIDLEAVVVLASSSKTR